MPTSMISALGLMLAAAATGAALYQWRRASSYYALLVEGSNRFEELRQRSISLEQLLAKAEEQKKLHIDVQTRNNSALDEARKKTTELSAKLQQKEHELSFISEKLELQKGHLERELAKAQAQVQHYEAQQLSIREREEQSRQELRQLQRAVHEEKARISQELILREKDWQAKLIELSQAKEQAEKNAALGDPVEMKRLKRKINHYGRLYVSMKGLREMTDERNRNWEVALQKLSAWILEEKGENELPQSIGPLVGKALQSIGAQLIDDLEDNTERQGAGAVSTDPIEEEHEDRPHVLRGKASPNVGG